MTDLHTLHSRRLERWGQTPGTRLAGAEQAPPLIERWGLATLFPASPELPNLYHAYMGDPEAGTESAWDSPSGEVYTWRWVLGRREVAFYTAIVRDRPTWVSWALLPAVIRLRGELRALDELHDSGVISPGAYRLGVALEEAGGALNTGALRERAGFPTGKEQRAAYLRAMAELDTRLLVAKVFTADGDEMSHALVAARYPDHVATAERLTHEQALDQFLAAYLPQAAYAVPAVLARHLKVPEPELRAGLERLAAAACATPLTLPEIKGLCYAWHE